MQEKPHLHFYFSTQRHPNPSNDVGINGPAKKCFTKEVTNYKNETNVREIRSPDFVKVLQRVNEKVLKKETIVNGFRETGIFPLDPSNVHLDRAFGGGKDKTDAVGERNDELKSQFDDKA